MIKEGNDVYGLIREWHAVFPLGGLVSTLPEIIHPLITNRWLKKYLMPQKGHKRGSGHIMSVSNVKGGAAIKRRGSDCL